MGFILAHLPVWPVVLPLLAAAACAIVKNGRTAWHIASITNLLAFLGALALASNALDGEIRYYMGGWAPPIGIEYRADPLGAFIIALVSFIGLALMPFARESIAKEILADKEPLFYCTYLLCLAGLLGIASTNDVFNIYVFLEISSLATYALISMGGKRKSLTAAFEYLILGTLGATFILIGIGLLYMMTGSLNIDDIHVRLAGQLDSAPVDAAFAFITIGVALKVAMFPLHIWLTNAYSYAPSFGSAFLSATATKVSLYVFIRMLYDVFDPTHVFGDAPLSELLLATGVAGILIGSIAAIYQHNAKRLLAFSSIAQLGYIIVGIALASEPGLAASITHLANHAFAKAALFVVLGAVMLRVGDVNVRAMAGIGKRMPWTCAAFVLAGFSLIGVPFTAGFVSKWMLIQAVMDAGHWWLIGVILVSSLLAVVYIWRVVEVMYLTKPTTKNSRVKEAPTGVLITLWVLVGVSIVFGVWTDWTAGVAAEAARLVMEGVWS